MHMTGKIFKRSKRGGDPIKEGTAEIHKMGLKEGLDPQAGVTVLNCIGNESYGGGGSKLGKMASK